MMQSDAGRWKDAIESHLAALALKADDAETRWSLSLSRLRFGDFAQGWEDYEARWQARSAKLKPRKFGRPLWLGDAPLQGKTILLHAEQGLGDTLQFCRFVPLVAEQGARVILEVQPPLRQLMATLAGVSHVTVQGETLPPFDLHCPLMSLPRAFRTTGETVPKAAGYLHAPAQKLASAQTQLGPYAHRRIGFVWSGNPKHKNDHRRSLRLEQLLAVLPAHAQLFSFQKDLRPEDQALLERQGQITSLGEHLHDFTDTAAYCAAMDLIVSVDTSLAHLAGALAKPTWILLPFNPDWRWMLDRSDSPWYDAVKLYRQDSPDNWRSVLDTLKADLVRFCAA